MVLRCSLLGHDYGDAEVEREREERGSEVVLTVQEYEECTRCGERNVVSENTEVRSLSAGGAAGAAERDPDAEPDADADPRPDAGGEDAEFVDDGPEPDAIDDAEEPTDEIEVPTDENGDPVTDDGEILEDDGDEPEPDRERGEWPDSDDVGPPVDADDAGDGDWPDEDETDDSPEDDGVILEDDATGGAEAPGGAESVAAEPSGRTDGAEAGAAASGTGIERAGSAPAPGSEDGTTGEDVPTEFYCPRCEFVAPGDRGSLRSGDICPDCRKGYLSERERR